MNSWLTQESPEVGSSHLKKNLRGSLCLSALVEKKIVNSWLTQESPEGGGFHLKKILHGSLCLSALVAKKQFVNSWLTQESPEGNITFLCGDFKLNIKLHPHKSIS